MCVKAQNASLDFEYQHSFASLRRHVLCDGKCKFLSPRAPLFLVLLSWYCHRMLHSPWDDNGTFVWGAKAAAR